MVVNMDCEYCAQCGAELIEKYESAGKYSRSTGEKIYYKLRVCPRYSCFRFLHDMFYSGHCGHKTRKPMQEWMNE